MVAVGDQYEAVVTVGSSGRLPLRDSKNKNDIVITIGSTVTVIEMFNNGYAHVVFTDGVGCKILAKDLENTELFKKLKENI